MISNAVLRQDFFQQQHSAVYWESQEGGNNAFLEGCAPGSVSRQGPYGRWHLAVKSAAERWGRAGCEVTWRAAVVALTFDIDV